MKHTLSVVTEDRPGVLARVASLCARRGFNIHSLAVGPIHEPDRSRITLVVDAAQVEQVTKQLHKLIHVIKITELEVEESVEREVMLLRVNGNGRRAEVMDASRPGLSMPPAHQSPSRWPVIPATWLHSWRRCAPSG